MTGHPDDRSRSSLGEHKAIVLDGPGGPEMLAWRTVQTRSPGPGQVLVDVSVAGVNFMDIGTRTGQNGPGPFPLVPGVEGAGRITAVGEGVEGLRVGQRVGWRFAWGSYTQRVLVLAEQAVPLPDDIDDDIAAAVLLQGLSAQHFVDGYARVRAGETVLVHAAAGGVGHLVTQMAKNRGARVIARVSNQQKGATASSFGADDVIVDSVGVFADEVKSLTSGRGVDVVFDGSGQATFQDSIESLAVHGIMAYFGPVIGSVPRVELTTLPNSILVGYPTVDDHVRSRADLLSHTQELFELVRTGRLKVAIGKKYSMEDAAQSHVELQSRRSTGKLLLLPGRRGS